MARIRTIKPEFFTSEDIVELEPMARLLYIALWCEADKEGRLVWKPKTFKIRYFPADDIDIERVCDALVTRGLVSLYGQGFAFIPKFKQHQHINPRESASILPEPDDASATRESRVNHATVTHREEGKGRERKGKEHASATRIPPDFSITPEIESWAKEKGFSRLPEHLEHFRGVAEAKGYAYVDWVKAFQNAIRANWAKLDATPQGARLVGGINLNAPNVARAA